MRLRGCLVLDVRLPGMSGTEFQQEACRYAHRDPHYFHDSARRYSMVRKVMRAGAVEFLTKPFQKEELLSAIQDAFAIDRARRRTAESNRSIQKRFELLTAREREVMKLITGGFLNKQAAARLRLSEITVKLHRRHVIGKDAGKFNY